MIPSGVIYDHSKSINIKVKMFSVPAPVNCDWQKGVLKTKKKKSNVLQEIYIYFSDKLKSIENKVKTENKKTKKSLGEGKSDKSIEFRLGSVTHHIIEENGAK